MPKHFLLNSICLSVIGIFTGYGATDIVLNSEKNMTRDIASLILPNILPLKIENIRTIGKIGSQQAYQDYFDVKIKHEHISNEKNGQSVLKAIITAKKDLPAGLGFKWKLGKNAQANQNDLVGYLQEIKSGDQQEIYLNIYGFDKLQKSFISLHIGGLIDGQTLTKETLSASRPEDAFEYIVQKINEAEVKAMTAKAKGLNKLSTNQLSTLNKKFSLDNIVK